MKPRLRKTRLSVCFLERGFSVCRYRQTRYNTLRPALSALSASDLHRKPRRYCFPHYESERPTRATLEASTAGSQRQVLEWKHLHIRVIARTFMQRKRRRCLLTESPAPHLPSRSILAPGKKTGACASLAHWPTPASSLFPRLSGYAHGVTTHIHAEVAGKSRPASLIRQFGHPDRTWRRPL